MARTNQRPEVYEDGSVILSEMRGIDLVGLDFDKSIDSSDDIVTLNINVPRIRQIAIPMAIALG